MKLRLAVPNREVVGAGAVGDFAAVRDFDFPVPKNMDVKSFVEMVLSAVRKRQWTHPSLTDNSERLKKNLKNISGTYVSPGSGCVVKKHSVGYVELVFGCLS